VRVGPTLFSPRRSLIPERLRTDRDQIALTETAEVAAISEFDAGPWGKKYPMIAESWRRNWEHITPFYSYPPEVRKIILHH
jgi:transposase-like protein